MKNILLASLLFLFFSHNSVYARKIHAKQSGSFDASATWVDGKTPNDGDTITIDSGHTVSIKSKLSYSGYLIRIVIYGVLDFSEMESKLKMPYGSSINVMTGGKLTSSGSCQCSRTIEDGSFTYWQACEGAIKGPERIE